MATPAWAAMGCPGDVAWATAGDTGSPPTRPGMRRMTKRSTTVSCCAGRASRRHRSSRHPGRQGLRSSRHPRRQGLRRQDPRRQGTSNQVLRMRDRSRLVFRRQVFRWQVFRRQGRSGRDLNRRDGRISVRQDGSVRRRPGTRSAAFPRTVLRGPAARWTGRPAGATLTVSRATATESTAVRSTAGLTPGRRTVAGSTTERFTATGAAARITVGRCRGTSTGYPMGAGFLLGTNGSTAHRLPGRRRAMRAGRLRGREEAGRARLPARTRRQTVGPGRDGRTGRRAFRRRVARTGMAESPGLTAASGEARDPPGWRAARRCLARPG